VPGEVGSSAARNLRGGRLDRWPVRDSQQVGSLQHCRCDVVSRVGVTFHARATCGVLRMGEAGRLDGDHLMALHAAGVRDFGWCDQGESLRALEVIDDFPEGGELVLGSRDRTGVEMTVNACDSFVRSARPSLVVRCHFVTCRRTEGGGVCRACQSKQSPGCRQCNGDDHSGDDSALGAQPEPAGPSLGSRRGELFGRDVAEDFVSAHAHSVDATSQAIMNAG